MLPKAITVAKKVGASSHLVNATHSKIDPALFLDGQGCKSIDLFSSLYLAPNLAQVMFAVLIHFSTSSALVLILA